MVSHHRLTTWSILSWNPFGKHSSTVRTRRITIRVDRFHKTILITQCSGPQIYLYIRIRRAVFCFIDVWLSLGRVDLFLQPGRFRFSTEIDFTSFLSSPPLLLSSSGAFQVRFYSYMANQWRRKLSLYFSSLSTWICTCGMGEISSGWKVNNFAEVPDDGHCRRFAFSAVPVQNGAALSDFRYFGVGFAVRKVPGGSWNMQFIV